jgi:hypothetical protein
MRAPRKLQSMAGFGICHLAALWLEWGALPPSDMRFQQISEWQLCWAGSSEAEIREIPVLAV